MKQLREEEKKNVLLVLWRWLNRRGYGFDLSSSCLGALALTIMLSQKLWSEWPSASSVQQFSSFVERSWPYFLALLLVYLYESWKLSRHLQIRTAHSKWWTVPLILPLIVFALCPPNWTTVHGCLLGAFILLQLPLFIDRNVKDMNETE